jgi:1,4-dihydroxy-2-naphthoate octaprenyltransferase
MASIGVWIQAARPRTLPAAVVPVAVGTALAAGGHPCWAPALGCLAGALLIQIGCNFANDAFDALKGADTAERVGPRRAVAAGLISARTMLAASVAVLALALVVGLYLTHIAGWPILVLGLVSIACALAYTGGPFPLAYVGLGDLFVFLFFGLAAVLGSAVVQMLALRPPPVEAGPALLHFLSQWFWHLPQIWLIAAAVGLQCTAIIAVNNLRDIATDTVAGKRTLAVRIGDRASRWYYLALHLAAAVCYGMAAILLRADGQARWGGIPCLVAFAGGVMLARGVFRAQGPALNGYLARTAALEMLTGALLVTTLSI